MDPNVTANYVSIRDRYPETLDVIDIQKIMGIGRVQAYNLANSKQFHIVKVGSRIKVSRDVFFNWLEGK